MMLNETDTTALYAAMGSAVTGQEAFVYQVTNVSWVPISGLNGFSGFNIVNLYNAGPINNRFGPPGWDAFAAYSGPNFLPTPPSFEWDIKDTVGNGLLVGQTGLFGFIVAAGRYIDISYGPGSWMHSWSGGGQVNVANQDDISGPELAIEITKEIIDTVEGGDTDGVLETGEDWQWTLLITVTNVSSVTAINVYAHDRLGGDLELHTDGLAKNSWHLENAGDGKPIDVSQGEWQWYTKGKTKKVFLEWNVGSLDPGASATMTVTVSPDMNPGNNQQKGKKDPATAQEYTSTGDHDLNSGAYVEGYWNSMFRWAQSDPITVTVVDYVEGPNP